MDKRKALDVLNRIFQIIVIYWLVKFLLSLKWYLIWDNIDKFPKAIGLTIFLTVSGLLLGFIIAVPLALFRSNKHSRFLQALASGYVALFRGTPLFVQMSLFYFGLAQFEWVRNSFIWFFIGDALPCAVLVIGLNSGAYACEIFRGALQNVPKGQIEAAMSLGMSKRQSDWLVWVPVALRKSIPQYGNELIFTMHGTALAGLVTINEVFGTAREINNRYYVYFEGMITAAIIYVTLTFCLSLFSRWLERKYLKFS